MEETDDYGPEDFLRALNKVWDGTSSGDEQTSIDFFLLRVLQSEGSQGITRLLQGFAQEAQGTLTVSESGEEVLHTVSRKDRHQLSITTCADPDMTWAVYRADQAVAGVQELFGVDALGGDRMRLNPFVDGQLIENAPQPNVP